MSIHGSASEALRNMLRECNVATSFISVSKRTFKNDPLVLRENVEVS